MIEIDFDEISGSLKCIRISLKSILVLLKSIQIQFKRTLNKPVDLSV